MATMNLLPLTRISGNVTWGQNLWELADVDGAEVAGVVLRCPFINHNGGNLRFSLTTGIDLVDADFTLLDSEIDLSELASGARLFINVNGKASSGQQILRYIRCNLESDDELNEVEIEVDAVIK